MAATQSPSVLALTVVVVVVGLHLEQEAGRPAETVVRVVEVRALLPTIPGLDHR
jgi:hypothetical protein